MGVAEAIAAKRAANFAYWFDALLKDRRLTPTMFAKLVYGSGKFQRGFAIVQTVLAGDELPVSRTVGAWTNALGLNKGELSALADKPTPNGTPAGAIVSRPVGRPPGPKAAPTPTPATLNAEQFAFVVDANGKATIRLNMVGIPLDVGLKVMASLTAAGLLGAPASAHD